MRTLNIAHHRWTVAFESEPVFEESTVNLTFVLLLLLGTAASIWLFFFSRGQALARAQAEIASQARGAFLATMSHELRTPLNAIGGYVELMALEIPGPLNEKQQEYLVRISRAQTHLLGLINSILNYSKLEARRVQFRISEVDVATVVGNTETLITPQTEAGGLTYTNRGGPAVAVRADEEKLTQILLNLLSNAIKFTDRGGAIVVWWDVISERVRIHVQDTGIGIEPVRLDAIFDPFIQVDADLTRTVQGTGLGLSIARELARAMGGDLTVESVFGAGATFTIVLPRVLDKRG